MTFKECGMAYVLICPFLKDKKGHDFNYATTLLDQFKKNNKFFKVMVPKSTFSKKHLDFIPLLPLIRSNSLARINYSFFFIKSLRLYLNGSPKHTNHFIIESFHIIHLVILVAFMFRNKDFKLAMILRYKTLCNISNVHVSNLLLKFLMYSLPQRLTFFTDSKKIKIEIETFHRMKIHLLPIPHTQFPKSIKKISSNNQIKIWLPGPPRTEKGINQIKKFINSSIKSSIVFYISADAEEVLGKNNNHLKYVKSELSSKEYYSFFKKIDYVILPYDKASYTHSTSGIFVESIAMGVPALVTNDSWMSNEYKDFSVDSYIFDWSKTDLYELHHHLLLNTSLLSFKKMVTSYRKLHNPKSFFQTFSSVLERL